jgi:sorting nexin-4
VCLYLILIDNLLSQSSTDYAQDHADLGAALNGFSLNESEGLSGAIEKTGQAVDATYMSTTKLVRTISIE